MFDIFKPFMSLGFKGSIETLKRNFNFLTFISYVLIMSMLMFLYPVKESLGFFWVWGVPLAMVVCTLVWLSEFCLIANSTVVLKQRITDAQITQEQKRYLNQLMTKERDTVVKQILMKYLDETDFD